MKKIEGLDRVLTAEKQERRAEGIRRERWVLLFGDLQGYHTDWVDTNGFNYMYDEQAE